MATDIVVVGSLNMDLVVKVPRAPEAGETVRGSAFQMVPGGKGANQAAAAARLGAQVSMVGRVGQDAFGPVLIDDLARQGVDVSRIATDAGTSTGVALISVDETGENRIIISAGANGRVSRADIDAAEDLLQHAKFLIVQLEIPLEIVEYAMEKAARYPIQIILNPAPAVAVPASFLARADYLVPNESETRILTGLDAGDLAPAEKAARQLLGYGVHVVIITLGDKGALLVSEHGTRHVPARKVQVVDTTAAGDAFIGGLAVALARGFSEIEAVRYASCAGALAVTKFGAQTSLPSAEEVQALYQQVDAA